MSWWWAGAIGAAKKKFDEDEDDVPRSYESVGLVIGVTGIVGNSLAEILPLSDTPGGPWKVYGVARRPRPSWNADHPIEYLQCDISDEEDATAKLSQLADVTHLFYATWTKRESETANCQANGQMLANVLKAVVPNAPNLRHVCLVTGAKHYARAFEFWDKIPGHEPPFTEDLPRLKSPNFYYTIEDILFEEVRKKEGLTWSIHRPNAVFGFSPYALMNYLGDKILPFSFDYSKSEISSINCKHEGVPLRFPGTRGCWESFHAASDADLIAEQSRYGRPLTRLPRMKHSTAATETSSGGSICGGFWPSSLEWNVYDESQGRVLLAEAMKDKGPVWDEIVKENDLLPTKLEEVATWWFVDCMMGYEGAVDSMNKSKEHGFLGFRKTKNSLVSWVDKMKAFRLVP